MLQKAVVKSDNLFSRREAEKESARMRDYKDPAYGKAISALLKGAAPAPIRARVRS